MILPRVVAPETLDHLAEDDPAAMRSRRDLRRVHRAMGTRTVLLRALRGLRLPHPSGQPLRVLELGAGDGSLMLGVARVLAPAWPAVELTLLDRQRLVDDATLKAYAALRWNAVVQVADVLDWAAAGAGRVAGQAGEAGGAGADGPGHDGGAARWDLILANLFLHHFEGDRLAVLLAAIAGRSERFFACEPRRARLAWAGSHLIGALGVNAVTREDAVLSVHAGFRDRELSALWPGDTARWQVREVPAGLFSHCFLACRTEAV